MSTTTSEQDDWSWLQLAGSSLERFFGADLSDQRVARDCLLQTFWSGRAYHLLASVLVEEGQPWSVETAEANAEFFGSLTDPNDKARITQVLITVLAGIMSAAERHMQARLN